MSDWIIERHVIESTENTTKENYIDKLENILANTQDMLDKRAKMISNLQKELAEAGTLCKKLNSENVRLREEKDQLQSEYDKEYDKLVKNQYHLDYTVENQKKRIEDLGKTLALYEKENKAMRALLGLWV